MENDKKLDTNNFAGVRDNSTGHFQIAESFDSGAESQVEEPAQLDNPTDEELSAINQRYVDESLDEQTPEAPEDDTSIYATSAGSTPEPENYTQTKYTTSTLATDRAVIKRKRSEASPSEDSDAKSFSILQREKYKKRVTAKAIDKLWTVLESDGLKSVQTLCDMSMNKVLERYESSRNSDIRIAEVQRILSSHWIGFTNPKSFLARLGVTKLPPLRSLMVRVKGMKEDKFNSLNMDQMNHRKSFLEAYHSADLKQLENLETYYNSLQNTFNSDLQYLNDFKKTTSNLLMQISREGAEHKSRLHLDTMPRVVADLKMSKKREEVMNADMNRAKFDPNEDQDVKQILQSIDKEISQLEYIGKSKPSILDKLDIIERQLYSRKVEHEK